MIFTRALRKGVCRLLIGALLFAQLAVAAYACPGMSSMAAAATAPMSERHDGAMAGVAAGAASASDAAASAPCQDMDRGAANLCAEHCRYGQQSADHAPAPAVPAALLSVLYALPSPVPAEAAGPATTPVAASSVALGAALSARHAVLHCCFRI